MGRSVSRVGFVIQYKATNSVTGTKKLELAQYCKVAAFTKFGSDLDAATQQQLNCGVCLYALLKQGQYKPYKPKDVMVSLFVGSRAAATGSRDLLEGLALLVPLEVFTPLTRCTGSLPLPCSPPVR